jgi:hypothetical protein
MWGWDLRMWMCLFEYSPWESVFLCVYVCVYVHVCLCICVGCILCEWICQLCMWKWASEYMWRDLYMYWLCMCYSKLLSVCTTICSVCLSAWVWLKIHLYESKVCQTLCECEPLCVHSESGPVLWGSLQWMGPRLGNEEIMRSTAWEKGLLSHRVSSWV